MSTSIPPPFLVLAQPRSRTAWLSRFLTYGPWTCGHEQLRYMRGLDDVESWLAQPYLGSAETSVASWWRLLREKAPQTKLVIIRRSPEAIVDSVLAQAPGLDREPLLHNARQQDAKLAQVAKRWPGTLQFAYEDLAHERACALVFEHCLGMAHDSGWWNMLASVNVQVNFQALLLYMLLNKEQLDRFAELARQASIGYMNCRFRTVTINGVLIEPEPLDTFLPEGGRLFSAALAAAGEAPACWAKMNFELMRELERKGMFRLMVGRADGRPVGFLLTVAGPSFERVDRLAGTHAMTYCEPRFAGLGLRLQRASLALMRGEGIDEVHFRAGVRGNGPKMHKLYKRLGAGLNGQDFKLVLKE